MAVSREHSIPFKILLKPYCIGRFCSKLKLVLKNRETFISSKSSLERPLYGWFDLLPYCVYRVFKVKLGKKCWKIITPTSTYAKIYLIKSRRFKTLLQRNGRCFVHSFFYTQFRYKIHTKVLKQPKSLQKGPALEYRLDLLGTYCNMKGTIFFIVFYTNFTSETPTKVL